MESLWFLLTILLVNVHVYAGISASDPSQGDLNLAALTSHVLQLEQSVSVLQSQSQIKEQKDAMVLTKLLSQQTEGSDELKSMKLEFSNLTNYVLMLEETVSSLQSQTQTQEQKYSAVLSSVLSKLTGTTDELKDVKTELGELQNNYKELQSELATVKAQQLHNEESLIANISLIRESLKTEMNESEEQLSSEITELNSVILNLKASLNVTDRNLKNVQKEVGNMTDVIGTTLTGLNLTKQEIDHVSSQQLIFEAGIRADVLQLKSNVSNDIHSTQSTNQVIQDMSDKLKILQTHAVFEVAQIGYENNTSRQGILKFNYEKYDRGDVYNANTGIFTTPIDGTYLFWINGIVRSTDFRVTVFFQTPNSRICQWNTR